MRLGRWCRCHHAHRAASTGAVLRRERAAAVGVERLPRLRADARGHSDASREARGAAAWGGARGRVGVRAVRVCDRVVGAGAGSQRRAPVAERNDAKWLGRVKGGKVHAYPVHSVAGVGHVALAAATLARRLPAARGLDSLAARARPVRRWRPTQPLSDEAQWIGAPKHVLADDRPVDATS